MALNEERGGVTMILDLGCGILIALTTQLAGAQNVEFWLIVFGALAAVIVDIDFIYYAARRGWKIDHFVHEHRDILHYPIIVSGIGSIFFFIISPITGIIWCLATLTHFIHDTLENGWGVRWLWPFWNKYITLKMNGPRPKIIMSKQEQRAIAAEYGDPGWLDKELEFDDKFVAEITIFVFACIISTLIMISY